jgi:hypothetical protein
MKKFTDDPNETARAQRSLRRAARHHLFFRDF